MHLHRTSIANATVTTYFQRSKSNILMQKHTLRGFFSGEGLEPIAECSRAACCLLLNVGDRPLMSRLSTCGFS